jgi:hypothetical protein
MAEKVSEKQGSRSTSGGVSQSGKQLAAPQFHGAVPEREKPHPVFGLAVAERRVRRRRSKEPGGDTGVFRLDGQRGGLRSSESIKCQRSMIVQVGDLRRRLRCGNRLDQAGVIVPDIAGAGAADRLRPLNGVAALKDKVEQEDCVQTGLAGVESNNTVLGAMPVRQRYISIRRDGFVDEVLHKY